MQLRDGPQEGQHVTSARKRESNRRNGRKGRGPRTAAGKLRSSRNALRHGLASTLHRQVAQSQIERFARTLCGNDHNPLLFEQALTVAENHLMLRLIETQQLAVVERLWDRTETALGRGDNRLRLLKDTPASLLARISAPGTKSSPPHALTSQSGSMLLIVGPPKADRQ